MRWLANSVAGHVIVVHGFHNAPGMLTTFNVYDSMNNRESLITYEQLQLYPSPAGYMEWAMTFYNLMPN